MEEYIYAAARVHARENSLLRQTDLERLMACATEQECFQVLRDKGWSADAASAEELLAAEEEKTWAFLRELSQDTVPFALLQLPVDCNNLKAAVKCCLREEIPESLFLPGGSLSPEELLQRSREGDFFPLPSPWGAAGEQARTTLLQTKDGQLSDALVDRACMEEMLRLGEESGLEVLQRYGEWTVATADLHLAVRACRAGKNREFYQLSLAPCRSLNVEELTEAALRGEQELFAFLATQPWAEGAQLLQTSSSAFERWRDNQAMELIRPEKYETLTAGPLFAFGAARQQEIRTVRMILSGKRNGLEEQSIRERLRETYV